jgi:kynurenine formamidase
MRYVLQPLDIVMLATGADGRWGTPEYFTDFRGVTADATRFLVEQGIRVIGIDSFGFDPPFHRMLEQYRATGDKSALWPAHFYGRERPYCQIERLANLAAIPIKHGFKVACFPVKIRRAGAGWSRVVAITD